MASAKQSLENLFADIRDAGNLHRRNSLRHHAKAYRRNARTLLYWTFAASRAAVTRAIADPNDPAATRTLCRALWRDLQAARALPHYLAGRPMRVSALRLLFACECACYRRQRERLRREAPERPRTTGEWLTGICRAIEIGSTAGKSRGTPPRTFVRPRGQAGFTTASRNPPAALRQASGSYPGPSNGHRK